jgi:DNA-binding response OmpR family regulator
MIRALKPDHHAFMRVLIIDDHKGFRDELRQMLTRHGHVVDDVESAKDAVAMAETAVYDFLLLDYQMPEYDGLWFLRHARIPRHTKVLLVTSHTHNTLLTEMLRAGAVGYLIKPFDEEDVLRHLAFHSSRRTQVPAESPGPQRAASAKDSRNDE